MLVEMKTDPPFYPQNYQFSVRDMSWRSSSIHEGDRRAKSNG